MKNTLDEVLLHYENKEETKSVSVDTGMSESDYELLEYLCGEGNITNLYSYYDLKQVEDESIYL